jgi:DNA-binding SARP family transcriptional activator
LTIGVLGPLTVSSGDRPISSTSGRLRTLPAALALSADKEVSIEHLASIVWGEAAPAHVRRAVQTYVTRLRRLLGPGAIHTSPAGYRLNVAPERVDAIVFERLLDAAGSGDAVTERSVLTRALALWRGHPSDGLRSTGWRAPRRPG